MSSAILDQARHSNGALLEADALFEIVNGERVEVPSMGVLAGTMASILAMYLNQFALPRRLGLAVVEVLFQFCADWPQRRPDVAFLTRERWKLHPLSNLDPVAWEVVPNLTIEMVSPSNKAEEVESKTLEYFAAGVELVWVFFPRLQRCHVYTSPTQIQVLSATDELDGGTLLPNFRLKLADLFMSPSWLPD